ncbi:MAG: hypothetical protein B6D62_01460 [Candidatus Cloacimonas sp. 4484_275]|nr:MAG: hypothetical protein B6D62_01460 [Candidatus Cloacimonas sp. 4484_275]
MKRKFLILLFGISFGLIIAIPAKIKSFTDFIISDVRPQITNEFFQGTTEIREERMSELYMYDWIDESWRNYLKAVFHYDEEDNLYILTVYHWDNNNWFYDHKQLLFYDENNNISNIRIELWNSGWVPYYQFFFEYDENNNKTEQLEQEYEMMSGSWTNTVLYTLDYNEDNLAVQTLEQNWFDGDWQNNERQSFSYEDTNLIQTLVENWNGENWIISFRYSYSYDENDNMIERLKENYLNEEWQNAELLLDSYDENNNLSTELIQYWFIDEWFNLDLNSYTYNQENDISELLYQSWNDESWENDYKWIYFYEDVSSVEPDEFVTHDFSLSNFPNPFKNSTVISFNIPDKQNNRTRIEIYNVRGEKIRSFPISTDLKSSTKLKSKIIWNGTNNSGKKVAAGIYLYRLIIDEKTTINKKCVLLN